MPSTNEAIDVYRETKITCIPGKAANAGGVAVSGLEMSQNSQRLKWTFEEVDSKLQGIMKGIFDQMVAASDELGAKGDYQLGANVAGFLKVAKVLDHVKICVFSPHALPKTKIMMSSRKSCLGGRCV